MCSNRIKFAFVFLSILASVYALTVDEKLRDDSDLSQFYALLEANPLANITLQYRSVTLFVPTNLAFQRYNGRRTDVLYHMTNQALTLDQLASQGASLSTEMQGNAPLWITKRRRDYNDDLYINNAKIIRGRSDFISENRNGKKQVLHIIDEVLVPVLPTVTASNPIYNPDAYLFLNQSENFDIGKHRVRSFRQRVLLTEKQEVFKAEGRHTFFIPVEEGFRPAPRPDKIDSKVIDGHVIPNHVLFTHATLNDHPYETLAFGDNLKVQVTFSTTIEGKNSRTTVKSNTLLGNADIATGVVLAEIVLANIPVKNGVVHLIQRPLMIVDTNVTAFLKGFDQEDGPLYKFYELLVDQGQEFIDKLNHMRDLTLFAPSNQALNYTNNIRHDRQKLREILNLHLVNERLSIEKIAKNNMHSVPTAAPGKTLYFNVINAGADQILTVEGGGVNATVIQPNIAATNGIVHIIDRVLGVPYTNVLEKLRTDPMLTSTYYLGQNGGFNRQLNDSSKKFTYFVPRDKAWRDFELSYPSAHKKLFMREFSYHATQILERHLVVADVPFTMERMKLIANDTTHDIFLPTIRDNLHIRVREMDKSFAIEWQNEWINVFRPDVECVNGIIHVIDKPLLFESDIRVTGSASQVTVNYFISHLVMVLFVNWLIM